jgi:hypothetical protein
MALLLALAFFGTGTASAHPILKDSIDELIPLNQDCAQTYTFGDFDCGVGHDLYRYTGLESGDNSISSWSVHIEVGLLFTGTLISPSSPTNQQQPTTNQPLNCTCYVPPLLSSSTCQCQAYSGTDPTAAGNPQNQALNLGPACCDGWAGTSCDLCQHVDSCPPKSGDPLSRATSCTNSFLAPVNVKMKGNAKRLASAHVKHLLSVEERVTKMKKHVRNET